LSGRTKEDHKNYYLLGRLLDRELNLRPIEYEAGVLTILYIRWVEVHVDEVRCPEDSTMNKDCRENMKSHPLQCDQFLVSVSDWTPHGFCGSLHQRNL